MRVAVEDQVPAGTVADKYPVAAIVVHVHQLKDVVARPVDHQAVVGGRVHGHAFFLDPLEIQVAAADNETVGIAAPGYGHLGEVKNRDLAGVGPEIYPFGIRRAALGDRNARAAVRGRGNAVRPAPDIDRVSRHRHVMPFLQGCEGLGNSAGRRIAPRRGHIICSGADRGYRQKK